MTVPASDVLFVAGGEALARYGTIRKRTAIFEELVENHTRSSVAVGRDRGGVLRSHENDLPVIEWVDEDGDGVLDTPSVLLQGAGQNEFTRPEELDHADWTATNASVTADQANGPDDATSLDELVEDGTAGVQHQLVQGVTGLTADANFAFSVWAIENTRSWLRLSLFETAAGGNRVRVWFDLSDGSVGSNATAGTGGFVDAYVKDWTDVVAGLYRCVLVGSVGNSATAISGKIALATADSEVTYNGDGSSSLYAGYAQLEDDAEFASSYIATTTAALPRSADTHYHKWLVPPIEMTVYVKFVERGTINSGAANGVVFIGSSGASTDPRFYLARRGPQARYEIVHDNGTTLVLANISTAPSIGDIVELRGVLNADGSVLIGQSINGGTEETSTDVTTATLGDDWAGQRLYLNSTGSTNIGHNSFLAAKIGAGVHSMADMRAVQ